MVVPVSDVRVDGRALGFDITIRRNSDQEPATQEDGDITAAKICGLIAPLSAPLPLPVLSIDVTNAAAKAPARSFFDDMDGLEALFRTGISGRHLRLKSHAVVANAARILGWIAPCPGDEYGGHEGRALLVDAWRRIVGKTPDGNMGATPDEAIADFSRHLDAWSKAGRILSFKPRMPDFGTLPEFVDIATVRAVAKRIRRRLMDLMASGVLPVPEGGAGGTRHVAFGAARIAVEVLWPLARQVPAQCLAGKANIQAARMRAMCPSRRHAPVMRWLARANVLRATDASYVRPCGRGPGRTRLYFVNLPLVAWLAGVRKEDLSWTAR
jgi:hypothetical protein